MTSSVFCGRIYSAAAIAVLLFGATFAFSQGIVTGSISGVVQDQQGAVVPNATVTVTQLETNRAFTTQTTSAGIISLRDLPTGTYNLKIEMPSFQFQAMMEVELVNDGPVTIILDSEKSF